MMNPTVISGNDGGTVIFGESKKAVRFTMAPGMPQSWNKDSLDLMPQAKVCGDGHAHFSGLAYRICASIQEHEAKMTNDSTPIRLNGHVLMKARDGYVCTARACNKHVGANMPLGGLKKCMG